MHQEDALDLLKMGKNIFLTGAAGSGKTYLLNRYITYLKEHDVKVAITASTGIAATHIQGNTIHSWSGIGVRDYLSPGDIEKILGNSRVKRNYKNTKVLIIDEISMLHKHQLDMVDRIAKLMLDNDAPFGGMQVVVCGDFFQLPPVSSNPLSEEKQFAFESDAWDNGDFHICYLHEQHRQGDDPLLQVLSDIRSGTAGEHTKVPLRTRYKKEPEGGVKATKLYARNVNVDVINNRELDALPGATHTFSMSSDGWDALVDGLKRNCLALEELKLKEGAEVMFIKNDTIGRFVNGTRGVVTGFDRFDGNPVVRTYEGDRVNVKPEEWQYEENGIVRATITQIPLRLAWAITIHKSQGMTLDAAEMDLGDTFEPGMGYVALSRVRSLNGLKLMNLNEMALKVDQRILFQDQHFKSSSEKAYHYLQSLTEDEKTGLRRETLTQRFKGLSIAIPVQKAEKPIKVKKEKATPTHIVTGELLKAGMSVETIAKERGLTDTTILGHIEKLIGEKKLDPNSVSHLKNTIPMEDFESIANAFKTSEDGKLKPIYDKFEGKYSFRHIQTVRLFVA